MIRTILLLRNARHYHRYHSCDRRIVGESAASLFTAGSGYLRPRPCRIFSKIFESGGTLTIQLYLSMSKAQYDAAFGIAAVLLIIVLFINLLTKILAKKFDVSKLD